MPMQRKEGNTYDRSGSRPHLGRREISGLPAPGPQGPGPSVGVCGGKVEPGETKEQALIRECREELGITVTPEKTVMDVVHTYPDLTVHLTLFQASIAEGVPQKLEHNDIRWLTIGEADGYPFCPADEEILAHLRGQNP